MKKFKKTRGFVPALVCLASLSAASGMRADTIVADDNPADFGPGTTFYAGDQFSFPDNFFPLGSPLEAVTSDTLGNSVLAEASLSGTLSNQTYFLSANTGTPEEEIVENGGTGVNFLYLLPVEGVFSAPEPLSGFGIDLFPGDHGIDAVLTAYDVNGNLLGSVTQNVGNASEIFLGLQDLGPNGAINNIGSVTVTANGGTDFGFGFVFESNAPEPGTWLQALLGATLLGAAARRQWIKAICRNSFRTTSRGNGA